MYKIYVKSANESDEKIPLRSDKEAFLKWVKNGETSRCYTLENFIEAFNDERISDLDWIALETVPDAPYYVFVIEYPGGLCVESVTMHGPYETRDEVLKAYWEIIEKISKDIPNVGLYEYTTEDFIYTCDVCTKDGTQAIIRVVPTSKKKQVKIL